MLPLNWDTFTIDDHDHHIIFTIDHDVFSRLICFAVLRSEGDGGHHQREGGGGGSLINIASQMILHHDRCFMFSIEMT